MSVQQVNNSFPMKTILLKVTLSVLISERRGEERRGVMVKEWFVLEEEVGGDYCHTI